MVLPPSAEEALKGARAAARRARAAAAAASTPIAAGVGTASALSVLRDAASIPPPPSRRLELMEQRSDPRIVVDAVRVLCPADPPPPIPRPFTLPVTLSLPGDGSDNRPPRCFTQDGVVTLLRRPLLLPEAFPPFENGAFSTSQRKFSLVPLLVLAVVIVVTVVDNCLSIPVAPTGGVPRECCGRFLSRRRNGCAAASSTRILRAGFCNAKKK